MVIETGCHYIPIGQYDWNFRGIVPLPWNPTVYCVIAAFTSVPLWLTAEITWKLCITFKKYNGLYFWSILITAWALSIHAIGRTLTWFAPGCNQVFAISLTLVSWWAMDSGFALVLYSRLHLVVHSRRVLRFTLIMIIVDAILFHTPMSVAQFGIVVHPNSKWSVIVSPIEKLQVTVFFLQESTIAAIYILSTWKILKGSYNPEIKTTIRLLILAQVFVFFISLPLFALAYSEVFIVKAAIHPLIYAIKLKVEFVVLNQLLRIVKQGLAPRAINQNAAESQPSPANTEKKSRVSSTIHACSRRMSSSFFSGKKVALEGQPPSSTAISTAREAESPQKGKIAEEKMASSPKPNSSDSNSTTSSTTQTTPQSPRSRPDSEATLVGVRTSTYTTSTPPTVEDDGITKCKSNISDLEKQYLGRFGT